MLAARAVCTHPESALETAKKNDRARARMGGRIALPRIRQWVVFNTSSIERDGSRARRHATCAQGKCVLRGRARRGCRSGASLLGAAFEQGAAGGAEVAAVMGHARPDTINVRDVLLAEPHRIRFAGRALLRRPLLRGGRPRREREREAHERGRERGGHDRPELRLCDTNFHYRPSSWCSAPVSTVNPTSMASSAPCWWERLRDRGDRMSGYSIPMADGQLLGREQRDHAATLVGHHDLLFDAGGGVAVACRAIGLEGEYHALLDFGRMVEGDHA